MALIMCAVTALYIPGVLNTVASRVFPQIEKLPDCAYRLPTSD